MELFFKAAALILVTVVLSLFLEKLEKDTAVLMSIAACCVAGTAAFHDLEPVFTFLSNLSSVGNLQDGILDTLLKVAGITLVSEITGTICTDSGNGSLGKMLQLLGSGVILYLSLPIFQLLLDLLTEVMGEL